MPCRKKSEICLKDENNQCVEPFELDPSLNLVLLGGPFETEETCIALPCGTTPPPPYYCII